jgi:3-methyladenine DNA glycosylase AlkD
MVAPYGVGSSARRGDAPANLMVVAARGAVRGAGHIRRRATVEGVSDSGPNQGCAARTIPRSPAAERFAARLEADLRTHADAERADRERAYLKSDLAHLGVPVPIVRREVRALLRAEPVADARDLIARVEALWSRGVHDLRLAGAELAAAEEQRIDPSELDRLACWLREARTWALVDVLAPRVVGPMLGRHPEVDDVLTRWSRDEDAWLRRAALLAYLLPLRRGEAVFERFSAHADALLEDRSFWVRKALGWTLRERAKRRPDEVTAWLMPRRARASRLTLREATKRLPMEAREALLDRGGGPTASSAR